MELEVVSVFSPRPTAKPRTVFSWSSHLQREILEQHGIILTSLVGSGGQGQVYKGFHLEDEDLDHAVPVAVKIIQKYPLNMRPQDLVRIHTHVKREVEILRAVQHPRILQFCEFLEDDEEWFLITEFLQGHDAFEEGTLRVFTEEEILRLALQVLEGLEFLHSKGIAHRDVKLENLCFTDRFGPDFQIKLIDFGLGYFEDFDKHGYKAVDSAGTVKYRPPEVVKRASYDPRQVDVWAVGVIMYLLFSGSYPFDGQTDDETLDHILRKKESYSQSIWQHVSPETLCLVKGLLHKNPEKRLKVHEAIAIIHRIFLRQENRENELLTLSACSSIGSQTLSGEDYFVPLPVPLPPSPSKALLDKIRISGRSTSGNDKVQRQTSKPVNLLSKLTQVLKV